MMGRDMTDAFVRLAGDNGIPLPETLLGLYRDQRTDYGTDWPSVWKQRMLEDPPALISSYDFEWNTPEQIETVIAQWLAPTHQHGHRFFPFGRSGAGDAYCLMPLGDGRICVALIWHDRDKSRIAYPDFDAFIAARFVETMADLSHLVDELVDEDFSPEQARQCLLTDLAQMSSHLSELLRARLTALASGELKQRPYRYGTKRTESVWSLIAQDDEDHALGELCIADAPDFAVVARWDIAPSNIR
jgi:hypothetical protein